VTKRKPIIYRFFRVIWENQIADLDAWANFGTLKHKHRGIHVGFIVAKSKNEAYQNAEKLLMKLRNKNPFYPHGHNALLHLDRMFAV